ncbi:LOW QUALITY PROTEIN: NAC domain-containing protein 17-like [Hordeum vulgare subsp. vulgare]|nr:LOW QUALITY PROTEIN: NAC domain-containing protein 17-like [Hordeum vulgare subsp. vulgare]
MAQTCLPPGFRFHPTDVELVSYYLKRKIMGKKLFVEAISEVELYKFAPWDLPDKSCLQSKDLEWFFFCPRDKKYPKGSRTNRATPNGYRKTSGKDRTIELNSRIVGLKKTLIFHEGKAPKGNRTDWVMYEYKMEDETLDAAGFSKDAYVLCKIFKKSGLGPRIGEQYGAPFDENEWKNLDVGSSIFSFAPSSGVEDPQVESSALATPVIQEPFTPQQSVQFSEHVNICSNEDNNAPPEIDGIWLEELAMFLNDSPNHDIALPENSGLPPMSELEAQAFEMNTAELYDQLAGLAQSGDMSNVNFPAGDVGVTENDFQQSNSGFAMDDDYIELDDLFAPGETFSYDFSGETFSYDLTGGTFSYDLSVPNNQFLQYPLDQSTNGSHYGDGATQSTFEASGSLPPMPSTFDDMPSVSNKPANSNCLNPTMKDPFS